MELNDKIKAFGLAKAQEKVAKTARMTAEVELQMAMSAAKLDNAGNQAIGKVAIVYHTDYLLTPEAQEAIAEYETDFRIANENLTKAKDVLATKKKEAFAAGLAKVDKTVNYIKYTSPV